MAMVVTAALVAGCGGDDDAGGFGAGADLGAGQGEPADAPDLSGGDGEASGADGASQPEPLTDDPDGAVADFPIPSLSGAVDGIATEIDGVRAAQVWYDASRYDEVVDHYEDWFVDNGLIETRPDRSLGQIVIGGENESGAYVAIIINDGDRVFVQLSAE